MTTRNRRIAAAPNAVDLDLDERPPLLDQIDDLLQQSADLGKAILTGIGTSTEEGMMNSAMAREAANIMRAITGMSSELRQREKHAKDVVASLPIEKRHELIAEYIRELGHEDRRIFRDLFDDLEDKTKGVLG